MVMLSPISRSLFATSALCLASTSPLAAAGIQFNRDIRPILSDNCIACHGPDPGSRKAGLRLDTKEGFFAATDKRGATIVPGNLERSPLYQRLITTDPDDVMPPPKSHKELKPAEKELIRQWILEGAPWQPHWAYLAPERPMQPSVKNGRWVRNPIDSFVMAKLEAKGLQPAPEADRATLARRLALDLTGLPPKPEDVDAFVQDGAPDYYERYVKKLMDTPQWGEHRARYWLDAARYADTHGLHFDNYREIWPYRDWVIRAFNRNQSFDQFTLEQIAGDLLPDPTQEQLVATGFHRCNMTTNEGGTIEEENLVGYARDRVETTSWVWLGITANCAVCHDHKFDPVTMKDFYSMSAFFRNTTQTGFDGNVKDSNPSITVVTDPADQTRWNSLPSEIERGKKSVESAKSDANTAFQAWVGGLKLEEIDRELAINGLSFQAKLQNGTNAFPAASQGKSVDGIPQGELATAGDGRFGPAPKFDKANATVTFADAGDFDHGQPFSYGSWVYIPQNYNDAAALFARMDKPEAKYRGWDLWIQQGQFATHIIHEWPGNAIKVRTNKRLAKKGTWQHVLVTYDGSGKPEGVKIYVDGQSATTETENGAGITGSIRTTVPLTLAQRSGGDHLNGAALQDVRIYSRVLASAEVGALANSSILRELLGKPLSEWKPEPRQQAFDYYLATRHKPYRDAQDALARLERERESIRLKYPVTHVQMEKKNSNPMARVLFRGQYDKPRDEVQPAVFAALNPLPESAPKNRLGLAQWLIAPENPLAARVTVNRFWQEVFGTGIVKTSEDFGIMGEAPSNQELLDWLAIYFRDTGWDVKKLFRLVVTSATYRQSAVTTAEKLEKDPANRLLSRGPRFRLDGEVVRDYALSVSGQLSPKIGGASVRPYQPEGVWEAVAMPESNTRNYKRDTGEALYRRSMYTFWKRAAPPALMDIFNAPSREVTCTRRERTNTPLQALATMNDPQFLEAARHLAENSLQGNGGDASKALDDMAKRILSRPLRAEERAVVLETYNQLREVYQQKEDEARKLLSIGESKPSTGGPAPQLAALAMVANQLLNLDEVLNK